MLKPIIECLTFAQKQKRVLLNIIAKLDIEKYPTQKNFTLANELLNSAEIYDSIIEHLREKDV